MDTQNEDDGPPRVFTSSVVHRLNVKILSIGYIHVLLSFLNKNNIAFAANDLCKDLHLSNAEYGLGIAVLYTGFLTSRLIGNQCSEMIGAPKWFALTSFVWGAASIAIGFVQKDYQFYVLSGILGFAQGNAYPGMMQYLSRMYPPKFLDAAFAAVTGAIALSIPFTSVLSAAIVAMANHIGAEGWRLMLTVEGALPIIFSVITLIFLPDSLEKATFLDSVEKKWLDSEIKQERTNDITFRETVKELATKSQVWIISLSMFGAVGVEHSLMFFVNLVIRTVLNGPEANHEETCGSSGGHQMTSIALTAIPYLCCWMSCVLMGRYANRIKNRRFFAVTTQTVSGLLLALWAPMNAVYFIAGFVALTLSVGLSFPPQVAALRLAATSVSPAAAPLTLSFITTVFSLAGLVFPIIIGKVADSYGYGWGMITCGVVSMASGLLMIALSNSDKESKNEGTPVTHDAEACQPLIEESKRDQLSNR